MSKLAQLTAQTIYPVCQNSEFTQDDCIVDIIANARWLEANALAHQAIFRVHHLPRIVRFSTFAWKSGSLVY